MKENLSQKLDSLKQKIGEVKDVNAAVALMHWDMEVYMPPKAAGSRGQQLATLSAISHRMFTDPEMGVLLRELKEQEDSRCR